MSRLAPVRGYLRGPKRRDQAYGGVFLCFLASGGTFQVVEEMEDICPRLAKCLAQHSAV